MDPESFEQVHMPVDLLGEAAAFLQDNMAVTVDLVEGDPVGMHLPQTVVLEVVEADPVVQGPDRRLLLQARQALQRREDLGAAVHRDRREGRRAHRGRQLRGAGQGLIASPPESPPMAMRLSPQMTVMQNAAQRAAKRLLRDFNEVEQLQVSVKGPGDFVSQADLRAEQTLRDDLNKARPGYGFLLEESGAFGADNWAWRWVVDPLDGTTNFLHGIPHWAISIGAGEPPARRLQRDPGGGGLRAGGRRDVLGREGRGRLPQRAPPARFRPPRAQGGAVRDRHSVRRGGGRATGWPLPARSAC